ncbi:PilZ domain-containing protein [Methylobacterium dankookense]|uniref:PilZ domain-containing protein n=1 Tax=Methylobacterium dankookense TaxID=560405 RepID=A0A564FW94_9HYPH|nr:PilZ domain-containing protein [Methylobacterium dankookense]GJD57916.1 hypothetical protein IFDJLNFL_3829 [Methylobacterium dankookense]VUF12277.1 hypothetical protein MTDSW087_01966 [Methylobacterium dankookense]
MNERRRQQRRRTYLGGAVTFNHGMQRLTCLVRDLSEDGARFAFSDGVMLPEAIDLAIDLHRETRRARIVWRGNDTVGVAFVRPHAASNVVAFARP